jgi:hypothetical protein
MVYVLLVLLVAQFIYFQRRLFWIEQRLGIHKEQIGMCELRKDVFK